MRWPIEVAPTSAFTDVLVGSIDGPPAKNTNEQGNIHAHDLEDRAPACPPPAPTARASATAASRAQPAGGVKSTPAVPKPRVPRPLWGVLPITYSPAGARTCSEGLDPRPAPSGTAAGSGGADSGDRHSSHPRVSSRGQPMASAPAANTAGPLASGEGPAKAQQRSERRQRGRASIPARPALADVSNVHVLGPGAQGRHEGGSKGRKGRKREAEADAAEADAAEDDAAVANAAEDDAAVPRPLLAWWLPLVSEPSAAGGAARRCKKPRAKKVKQEPVSEAASITRFLETLPVSPGRGRPSPQIEAPAVAPQARLQQDLHKSLA